LVLWRFRPAFYPAITRRERPSTTRRTLMAWSKPKIVEFCVGLEINAYYPAEL